MATLPQLYRSTLRQFAANSIHARTARSPSIPAHLRVFFESGRAIERGSDDARRFERDVENLVLFLKARRLHKELVDRYNPTHDMTTAERVEATANRVGLQGPLEFDPSNPRPLPTGEAAEGEAAEEGQGTLQTMFAPKH
ncbi:hypothetical protein Rhopal_004194-T1 [Rhodotorula paludigena]|uniref:Uncharacterized protein n=1 Tax=Rhodotorula paludigena TaxID=86838 RepID=A0AAV5GFF6_9BASI|nr:hypothetical protein Rhopal_004194-T1 [Rhodotorula paludigena]